MTTRKVRKIDPDQLRAARKILGTVAEKYDLPPLEQSMLLHAVTLVALHDSLEQGQIEWAGPNIRLRLLLAEEAGKVVEDAGQPLALHPGVTVEEAGAAYRFAEELQDRHDIPEQERAGLFSALPCIGFHALEARFVKWKIAPPFAAIGTRKAKRRTGSGGTKRKASRKRKNAADK